MTPVATPAAKRPLGRIFSIRQASSLGSEPGRVRRILAALAALLLIGGIHPLAPDTATSVYAAGSAAPSDIFTFDNSFASSVSTNGSFTSLTPFGSCPTTPRGPCNVINEFGGLNSGDAFWRFTSNDVRWGGGFTYNPPINIGASYTFFMKFQITGYSTIRPYTKIVDFKNLAADSGLYFWDPSRVGAEFQLKLFPSRTSSQTKFAAGELMDLAIVRDDSDKKFRVYSRVPSSDPNTPATFKLEYEVVDTNGDGVPHVDGAGHTILHFFANDKDFDEGAQAGKIYDLRFWHGTALTKAELDAQEAVRPKAIITQQVTSYTVGSGPLTTPLASLSFTSNIDPESFPSGDRVIGYQVTGQGGTGCALTGSPPAFTATAAGVCEVTATIAGTAGFIGTTETFTINVLDPPPPPAPAREETEIPWEPETTEFEVTNFPATLTPDPPPPHPSGEPYTFTKDPTSTSNCTVDQTTSTMTVPQPGTCVVTASTPKTKKYAPSATTATFTITGPALAATGAPAWPLWAGVAVMGGGVVVLWALRRQNRVSA